MLVPTVRIKHPEHEDGILINESDFDETKHERVDGESEPGEKKLKVAEMRALLEERGVEVPEGAKKADLQALVDASTPS